MTVTLIGMPGAGKTCMGKALARKLKMKVVDGDRLIEERMGKKLYEIIDEVGLDGFKKIEEEVLLSINEDNIIISPGGSAVYYDGVMQHFKKNGLVVYLYVSPETLLVRLGDFSKRGIVLKEGQTIKDLYDERAPLMEKYADITINCNGTAYGKYQKTALMQIEKRMPKETT